MRVGCVKVSSVDQNTVRQLDGMEVDRVFTDKASGKDAARPKLEELIAFVREGDVVLVRSMDRLARNLEDLRRLVRVLTGKGVKVEFVKEGLAFTGEDSPMATLLLAGDGGLRRVRAGLDPGASARGDRRGQDARALHWAQARAHRRARPRAARACRRRRTQGRPCPGSASAARPSTATCAPRLPQREPHTTTDNRDRNAAEYGHRTNPNLPARGRATAAQLGRRLRKLTPPTPSGRRGDSSRSSPAPTGTGKSLTAA